MHLGGAPAGAGARRLSEITRIVSGKDWRVGVEARGGAWIGASVGLASGVPDFLYSGHIWLMSNEQFNGR